MNSDPSTVNLIATLWPVFTTIGAIMIGSLIWSIRLEGRVDYNEKFAKEMREEFLAQVNRVDSELKILTTKHESLDSKVFEQLSQVRESLARIEGALGVRSKNADRD